MCHVVLFCGCGITTILLMIGYLQPYLRLRNVLHDTGTALLLAAAAAAAHFLVHSFVRLLLLLLCTTVI
jgi:hypothetical protein